MTTKLVLLGEYVKVVGGYAFKSEDFTDEGIPVIRISDVQDGSVSIDKAVRIPNTCVGKGETYCIKPGDILIAMSGATTGKIGVVPNNFDGLILQNQRVGNFRITDPEKIDRRYLKHFVSSPSYQKQIWNSMVGVAQPNISSKQLENFEISLPPLEYQRRIAEVLDRAQSLISKRREAIAQLDTLTQAIFIEMFGDPVTNPKGWSLLYFNDLLSMPLRNGLSPSNTGKVMSKVLTLSAITGNAFDENAWKTSTFQSVPPINQRVDQSDFLICRGNGNIQLVGKGYFPTQQMPEVTFPDTMIAARILPEVIERQFLQHIWNSSAVRRQLETLARTTNGTFKVNQTMLEGVMFVVPPLRLQRKFACHVETVEKLKASHRASLSELDALFASLQHRAFRGEL